MDAKTKTRIYFSIPIRKELSPPAGQVSDYNTRGSNFYFKKVFQIRVFAKQKAVKHTILNKNRKAEITAKKLGVLDEFVLQTYE